jgi:uncharacterized Rmd1/YagE family protein
LEFFLLPPHPTARKIHPSLLKNPYSNKTIAYEYHRTKKEKGIISPLYGTIVLWNFSVRFAHRKIHPQPNKVP